MISLGYDSVVRCIEEEIKRLDAMLASRGREEAAARLRLGQALEVMSRSAVFELGFSSAAAYVAERCERSVRWAESARCLARRVERLPELRHGLASGRISWSMGELLARVAQPEDEARWVEMAASRTVRQMRESVAKAVAARAAGAVGELGWVVVGSGVAPLVEGSVAEGSVAEGSVAEGSVAEGSVPEGRVTESSAPLSEGTESHCSGDEMCVLTCTVNQEEAWLFEATRLLLERMGEHGADAQCEALLAEAQETLLGTLPQGTLDLEGLQSSDVAERHRLSELERWRAEAEARCESRARRWWQASRAPSQGSGGQRGDVAAAAALGMASLEPAGCGTLDGLVRALSEGLARHELELSLLVLRFHRADGWRRLGYATETQYARERLGVSRSAFVARRSLALRLEKLPGVAAALGAGQIGVEAALQLVRVATTTTEAAWVARARRRTIRHLREEVAAALVAVRISGEVDCPPPADGEMVAFHCLEQAVVSGRVCQGQPVNADLEASKKRRAWSVMLGSLAAWLASGLQTSAGGPSPEQRCARSSVGRVTLRLRMSRATGAWWRALEAQARPWLPRGMSWLRFMCLSLWDAWRHMLEAKVAYGQIYARDRYRCTSPVCTRRDVTPHHLVFRSAGGSDEDDNLASLCTWCHLYGVHGGRIRARGTASSIRWELGPVSAPCVVVEGRERL